MQASRSSCQAVDTQTLRMAMSACSLHDAASTARRLCNNINLAHRDAHPPEKLSFSPCGPKLAHVAPLACTAQRRLNFWLGQHSYTMKLSALWQTLGAGGLGALSAVIGKMAGTHSADTAMHLTSKVTLYALMVASNAGVLLRHTNAMCIVLFTLCKHS